jgi:DNA-binding PadR family transcriptional regulator
VLGKLRVTDPTLDVLAVLLGPDDQLYGLKIANKIGRPTGSVFPILARLEHRGWVVSEWEASEARGPRRRFYRLSPEGVAGARALLAERGRGPVPVSTRSRILRPRTEGAR